MSRLDLTFTFRPLVDSDLAMMHCWLNEPGVVRWWEGDDVSMSAVTADYGSDRADVITEHWIAEIEGQPIGWICCWPVTSDLDEAGPWLTLGVDDTAAGIDYLVAAPDRRGQGVGSQMIRSFVATVVFAADRSWTQSGASPYTANIGSCRALEKAGFRFAGSIQYPDDKGEGPCSLMVIDRPAQADCAQLLPGRHL